MRQLNKQLHLQHCLRACIGTACLACHAGTYDVLRVRLEEETGVADAGSEASTTSGSTVLVPFAADIVPVVNRTERTLEINPPPGLLELARKQPAAKPSKLAARRKTAAT